MLLSLLAPSFALTVPVQSVISDQLHAGGTERSRLSGSVGVSNPATGATYELPVDELTVNKREAGGAGRLAFAGDPSNTTRTWAICYLDENGKFLGKNGAFEIVSMVFDAEGNGSLAARDTGGADLVSLRVRPDARVSVVDGARASAQVQDAAANASFIGIMELEHEGADLLTDPDMTILDADTYAAFQALDLDAMLPIDSWRTTLQGDLTVEGLSVARDGTIEGGAELLWDVTVYEAGFCQSIVCDTATPVVLASTSYLESIGAVKRKSGQPPTVKLQPQDVTYDSWDRGVDLVLEGDYADLEFAASLELDGAVSEVVTLDPHGFGVTWEADSCGAGRHWHVEGGVGWCVADMQVDIFLDGDFLPSIGRPIRANEAWYVLTDDTFEIAVYDAAGTFVASHTCLFAPTARTLEGTARVETLVGECTRDTAGTEVRRLTARLSAADADEARTVQFDVEMAGAAFTRFIIGDAGSSGTRLGDVLGGTVALTSEGLDLREAALTVTETTFHLPFAFASDPSRTSGELMYQFDDPTRAITWRDDANGTLGYERDVLVYDIAFDDIELVSDTRDMQCGAAKPKVPTVRNHFCHSQGD